jgi:uncharacterized membrane protein
MDNMQTRMDNLQSKMRGNLPMIAALAVGAWWLSNQTRRVRLESAPHYSVEESLVVRVPVGKTVATVAVLGLGAMLASSLMKRSGDHGVGSSVEESIDLDVPLSTAYNQWTQFEQFPRFMTSVEEVKQLDDTHIHWRANVAGKTKEWDAEITEQVPDERIAWRSTGGVRNSGVVTFHKLGEARTKVTLRMDYEPENVYEKVGDALGGVKLTTKGNLKRFKQLVEGRGAETGAWRGTVAPH